MLLRKYPSFGRIGFVKRDTSIFIMTKTFNERIDEFISLEKDDEKISLLIKKKESYKLIARRKASDSYKRLKKKIQKKSAVEKIIKLEIKKEKMKAIYIVSRIKNANSYEEITKATRAYYDWRYQNPWLKGIINDEYSAIYYDTGFLPFNSLVNMVDGMRIK